MSSVQELASRFVLYTSNNVTLPWLEWIRRLPSKQRYAGSNPAGSAKKWLVFVVIMTTSSCVTWYIRPTQETVYLEGKWDYPRLVADGGYEASDQHFQLR